MNLLSRLQSLIKRETTLVVLLLFAVLSVFYYRMIWWDWILYEGDMWTQYFPAKWYFSSYIKQGIFPLWTPNLLFGFPLFAEAQAGMLYPLSFIFYFLPTIDAFNVSIILRVMLGGVFTFLYVRRITGDFWGSTLSGLTFACGGYMTAQLRHENVGNALVWLPLILLLLDRWIELNERRSLAAAALCMGTSFLAGYFYVSFFVLITATVYYIFISYVKLTREKPNSLAWRPLCVGLILFGVTGIGLAAVQILPSFELVQESIRSGGLSYEISAQVSYPPFQLIGLLFPKFFGYPPDQNTWGMWRGNFIDLVVYLGILPLLTMIGAIMIRKDRYTFFFSVTFGVALLLAFGQFSPLWILVNKLPIFSMMRNPARLLSIVSFSGAVLAGLGLSALMTSKNIGRIARFRKALFIGSGIIISGSLVSGWIVSGLRKQIIDLGHWFVDQYVYGRSVHEKTQAQYNNMVAQFFDQFQEIATISHPYIYVSILSLIGSVILLWLVLQRKGNPIALGIAILVLSGSDLTIFGRHYNNFMPPEIYDQKQYYTEAMETDNDIFRYCFAPLMTSMRNYDALRFDQMYIQGHSPVKMKRQQDIIDVLRPQMQNLAEATSVPLMNMLNIKYIITEDSLTQDWALAQFDEGAKVYENLAVMSRAFFVPRARVLPTGGDVLAALANPVHAPGEEVLFEEAPDLPELLYESSMPGKATMVRYGIDDIAVDVKSEGGYLVLTDMFFPGWYAEIDGEEQKILRANYAFRAIQVPPGEHRVEFRYSPLSFSIGAGLSLFSLAACLGMMVSRNRPSI